MHSPASNIGKDCYELSVTSGPSVPPPTLLIKNAKKHMPLPELHTAPALSCLRDIYLVENVLAALVEYSTIFDSVQKCA